MLCACESFQSSVPFYPVNLTIDTRIGAFVTFQETNLNSHVVVNREGYFLDGKYVLPTGATDQWGYGGVVVYVSMIGYVAYDLACPYCAAQIRRSPCEMDGIFAVCPHCGEKYELGSGYALPQNGICKEHLRKLNILNTDGKLKISQSQ